MKANLLYTDRDFDPELQLPENAQELSSDLELDVLFDAMAADDDFLRKVARSAVLQGTTDLEIIAYRQEILSDCLSHPEEVRSLYNLIVGSIEGQREVRWWGYGTGRYPSSILSGALKLVDYYIGRLRTLRDRAGELEGTLVSRGFRRLIRMLAEELSDEYLELLKSHVKELGFNKGVLMTGDLGDGLKGSDYLIRKPNEDDRAWYERLLSKKPESYSYTVPDKDEAAAKALSELRDRGINAVANAVAQSAEHIRSFYEMLKSELAFYVACINLHDRLTELGEPTCLPRAHETGKSVRTFEGLYDICLSLTAGQKVVGNDVNADSRSLVVITGANHGGKSTFLRSVGLSQLMMQCGMFVGARSFNASVCSALFTHFKREEDAKMESGKFDEELKRMDEIAETITPGALMLFNESFAATNEREGSEISRQVVRALVEHDISVLFVTHQYDFAKSTYDDPPAPALFLRAERNEDGSRSYKLIEAPPLETSYGKDLYREVFESAQDSEPAVNADVP